MTVSLVEEEKAYCIIDGNNEKLLDGNDKIEIYSEETLTLVVPNNRDYYSVIREKVEMGRQTMLRELKIENLAIIEELDLEFQEGFVVLTGETEPESLLFYRESIF